MLLIFSTKVKNRPRNDRIRRNQVATQTSSSFFFFCFSPINFSLLHLKWFDERMRFISTSNLVQCINENATQIKSTAKRWMSMSIEENTTKIPRRLSHSIEFRNFVVDDIEWKTRNVKDEKKKRLYSRASN